MAIKKGRKTRKNKSTLRGGTNEGEEYYNIMNPDGTLNENIVFFRELQDCQEGADNCDDECEIITIEERSGEEGKYNLTYKKASDPSRNRYAVLQEVKYYLATQSREDFVGVEDYSKFKMMKSATPTQEISRPSSEEIQQQQKAEPTPKPNTRTYNKFIRFKIRGYTGRIYEYLVYVKEKDEGKNIDINFYEYPKEALYQIKNKKIENIKKEENFYSRLRIKFQKIQTKTFEEKGSFIETYWEKDDYDGFSRTYSLFDIKEVSDIDMKQFFYSTDEKNTFIDEVKKTVNDYLNDYLKKEEDWRAEVKKYNEAYPEYEADYKKYEADYENYKNEMERTGRKPDIPEPMAPIKPTLPLPRHGGKRNTRLKKSKKRIRKSRKTKNS